MVAHKDIFRAASIKLLLYFVVMGFQPLQVIFVNVFDKLRSCLHQNNRQDLLQKILVCGSSEFYPCYLAWGNEKLRLFVVGSTITNAMQTFNEPRSNDLDHKVQVQSNAFDFKTCPEEDYPR